MPKVFVDASIFTKTKAIGRISGQIDVPVIPNIGDTLVFGPGVAPVNYVVLDLLRVTERIIGVNSSDEVSLSLGDINVETADEALKVARFLEDSHGLFFEAWDDDA